MTFQPESIDVSMKVSELHESYPLESYKLTDLSAPDGVQGVPLTTNGYYQESKFSGLGGDQDILDGKIQRSCDNDLTEHVQEAQ